MKENCAFCFYDWTDYVWVFFKYFDTLRCYENAFLLLLAIIIFAIIEISKISNERELCLLLLRLDRLCLGFFKYFDSFRCYENAFLLLLPSSACHHHLCHHRNFKDF
ncbi:hypothetical protein CDAR_179191 [Caerostris darwini]|uniref:Uncharacterized protein n=1 Tax=Caerostris darwini TaxID=1538125 RepID=A0AAV4PD27_9ARAC|nr:hypothetical protein CDAR_179191 [Caerostris darwini]